MNEGCERPGLQFNIEDVTGCRWQDDWTTETGRKWRSWPRVRPVPGRMFRAESSTGLCPAAGPCLTGSSECLEQREEEAETRRWREIVWALAVTGDRMGSPGRVWAEDSWGMGHNRDGSTEASCLRFCVYLQQPLGALGWSGYHVNPTSPPPPPHKLDHPVVNFLKQYKSEKKKKRFDRNFNWACVGKFLKCSGCDPRHS